MSSKKRDNVFVQEKYTHVHKSAYYDGFKQVRNQLRKYHPYSVFLSGMDYLNHPVKDELKELEKMPWVILLLIKWTFIEDQYSTERRKNIEKHQFQKIAQMVYDLSSKVRKLNQYSDVHLFMRNIAYQQFIYQRSLNIRRFGRQVDLFIDGSEFYNNIFKSKVGIDIPCFLALAFSTFAKFIVQNENKVNLKWFESLFSTYKKKNIERFLSIISVDIHLLRDSLKSLSSKKREPYEFYEQTPFLKQPLVKIENVYFCVDKRILFRCLENYIYDTIRAWNPSKFMVKFGPKFEKYVEKTLRYTGSNLITENELQVLHGTNSKVVDFVVLETSSNIFIDAKGVEMPDTGKVAQVSEIIRDRTRDSIIKAIDQAHETNHQIYINQGLHPESVTYHPESYIVVVTFKELYLGNGKTFHDCIAFDNLEAIHHKYPDHVRIPFENMYFITIDELDLWSEHVKKNNSTFSACLSRAIKDDSEAQSRKFDFNLHLIGWEAYDYPQFLEDSWQSISAPVTSALKKSAKLV